MGFRPTRGVVSRSGALGMSWTQDQLGPVARSVEDAKTVFEVIAGFYDEEDNVTAVGYLMSVLTGSWLDPTTHHGRNIRQFGR